MDGPFDKREMLCEINFDIHSWILATFHCTIPIFILVPLGPWKVVAFKASVRFEMPQNQKSTVKNRKYTQIVLNSCMYNLQILFIFHILKYLFTAFFC